MQNPEPLVLPPGSAGAGARLHRTSWLPDAPPRAVVLLIHGYAEHAGRYGHVAAALTAQGCAVHALDHWGHGRSDGARSFVPAFAVLSDGVEALLAAAQAAHPGLPIFLLGHSLGGLIATRHLITHQQHYQGAVLSGPAIMPMEEPSRLLIWISRILSKIAPRMGVMPPLAEGVSRDPAVVAAYKADPLNYIGKMGARMAQEIFDAMANVRGQAGRISVPILLLHGEADILTAPAGSRFLFDHVGSTDKQIKTYPELFHEIFNEPERDAVLADVTRWIDAHLQ